MSAHPQLRFPPLAQLLRQVRHAPDRRGRLDQLDERDDVWLHRRLIDEEDLAGAFRLQTSLRDVLARGIRGLKDREQAAAVAFSLCGLVWQPLNLLVRCPPTELRALAALLRDASTQEVPQSVAEALLLKVCLPYLAASTDQMAYQSMAASRFRLARAATQVKNHDSPWVNARIEDAVRALDAVARTAGWTGWNPRNAIPLLREDRTRDRLPFEPELAHAMTAAVLSDAAWLVMSSPRESLDKAGRQAVDHCALMARDLQQVAWLTLEAQDPNGERPRRVQQQLIETLARLALMEHFLNGFGIAGCYARFAWDRDTAFVARWGESAFAPRGAARDEIERDKAEAGAVAAGKHVASLLKKELQLMMRWLFVAHEDSQPFFPRGRMQSPLVRYLREGDARLQPAFEAVRRHVQDANGDPQEWDGVTMEPLHELVMTAPSPDAVRAAVRGALYTGNLEYVRLWVRGVGIKQLNASKRRLLMKNMLGALGAAELLEFADVSSQLYQEMLPVANWHESVRLRNAIRRFWKKLDPESMTKMEQLFLHHTKIGLTHQALKNNRWSNSASGLVYGSVDKTEQDRLVRSYAQSVRYRLARTIRLAEFRNSVPEVPPNTAFVSLASWDGHVARAIVCARGQMTSLELPTVNELDAGGRGRDWDEELDEFANVAESCVLAGRPIGEAYSPSIESLVKQIALAVLALEPAAHMIYMHSDAMFRQIPWTFTLTRHRPVADAVRDELNTLRREGKRRNGMPWKRFVICHIPGLNLADDKEAPPTPHAREWKIDPDESDATCVQFAKHLREQYPAGGFAMEGGRLSVISHGAFERGAGVILEGEAPLSPVQLIERFGGWAIVCLHVCHASRTSTNWLGDLGGLPALFLSHGTEYLIASPLPVTLDAMSALESYVMALTRPQEVVDAFAEAADGFWHNSFYDLYGSKELRLVQPVWPAQR